MKNLTRQSQPADIKIEEIIDSFNRFALRDIRVNIDNPIAAFILASCFIDQMAAFAYNTQISQNGKNYRKFIDNYLKGYDALKLYENLRCLLVHNYSISENFALSNELIDENSPPPDINVNNFNIRWFIKELDSAFEDFCNDLRNNKDIRKNALDKYQDAPPLILVDRGSWQYGETEADYLVDYYTTKESIIGKPMNGDIALKIDKVEKHAVGDIFIVRCVAQRPDRNYISNLDIITQQLEVIYPTDALKLAGLYP